MFLRFPLPCTAIARRVRRSEVAAPFVIVVQVPRLVRRDAVVASGGHGMPGVRTSEGPSALDSAKVQDHPPPRPAVTRSFPLTPRRAGAWKVRSPHPPPPVASGIFPYKITLPTAPDCGFVAALGLGWARPGSLPVRRRFCQKRREIAELAPLDTGQTVVVIVILTVIAAATIAVPVLADLAAADRMAERLEALRGVAHP